MSQRGPRSPRWWSATTASSVAAGAWASMTTIPERTQATTVLPRSAGCGKAGRMPPSYTRGTTAWAGANSAHPRQGVATAALAGALDLIAGLGGGTVEGYPEGADAVPAGFLFNGALSTYEKLGFIRDRKIGKHRWVVTRVVEPRS